MEMMQPIPTRAKIARAWLEHAHSFDRCVCVDWLPLTADQNEKDSLVSSPVSHVLSKMAEDDNLSTDSF